MKTVSAILILIFALGSVAKASASNTTKVCGYEVPNDLLDAPSHEDTSQLFGRMSSVFLVQPGEKIITCVFNPGTAGMVAVEANGKVETAQIIDFK